MTAIETLIAGLFDYAGLYPPASLGMRSAANNYLEYRDGQYAAALGRFIVNLDRLDELCSIAGDSLGKLRLSVIVTEDADWAALAAHVRAGVPVDVLEIKCSEPAAIKLIAQEIPAGLLSYFEVPMGSGGQQCLRAIRDAGAQAKIRMGGVVPEAIPPVSGVVQMLKILAELRLPFKATAGLHHPLRSRQALTYQPQSPMAVMHGFMNLSAAAAVLYFGGKADEALRVLEEEDATAWRITPDALHWRNHSWSTDQLADLREQFLIGIGSCSFAEPIQDLESLGWL